MKDASEQDIAEYLLWVELERMGLTGTPTDQRLRVDEKSAKPSPTALGKMEKS